MNILRESDWIQGSATILRSLASKVDGASHRVEVSLHLSSDVFLSFVTLHPPKNRQLGDSTITALGAALRPLGYRLLTGMPPESKSKAFRRRLSPDSSLTDEGNRLIRTLQEVPCAPKGFRLATEQALSVSRRHRVPEKHFRRAMAWCGEVLRYGWTVNAIGRSYKHIVHSKEGKWILWTGYFAFPPSREYSLGLFFWSPAIGPRGWEKLKRSGVIRRVNREMSRLGLAGSWWQGPNNAVEWMGDFDRMTTDAKGIKAECHRLASWTFPLQRSPNRRQTSEGGT